MSILFMFSAAVIIVCVALAISKTKNPLLTAAKSAGTGISAMLLVNLVSGYTGCYIAVSPRTVFVAGTLSLPGVVCLLVMKIIFNY